MFRVGLKKIRVGRPTGTTHTFHLSLMTSVIVTNVDTEEMLIGIFMHLD